MLTNHMATSSRDISEREALHTRLATEIAAQGIVLLENRGVLPFSERVKSLALFGQGARCTIKGGTGSGDVNVRSFVTVEQGLLNAGYRVVSTPWMDEYDALFRNARAAYDEHIKEASRQGAFIGLVTMMSQPFHAPASRPLTGQELVAYPADAAIYVLSRNSGEGADRKAEPGDYYLTAQEIAEITLLARAYQQFVLLLNTGGVVDLTSVRDLPGVGAIVLISQGGSGCGDAAAAILSGKITPSGKLTATWARDYGDYPFSHEFAGGNGDIFDTYYKEGIYVGYRYFDTFEVAPAYPFGSGRSYTDFSMKVRSVAVQDHVVTLAVEVKNTGNRYAGREVAQLYVAAPGGKLARPSQVLAAFAKTRELLPGEQQTVQLTFSLERLASYDEDQAAWLLEQGDYTLSCGNSSRNTRAVAVITIPATVITEQCKNLFRQEKVAELTKEPGVVPRPDKDVVRFTADISKIKTITHTYSAPLQSCPERATHTFEEVRTGKATVEELVACLTSEELAILCVGAARINLTDITVVGTFSQSIPGAAGETTALLQKHGIPAITMVDGPAGIRVNPIVHEKNGGYLTNPEEDPIFRYLLTNEQAKVDLSDSVTRYQYCTALPVATMLAQTWDMELLEQAGRLIGSEMRELGVTLWLAPGMNIQRNPLCGRNVEYFSEDPLLSGLCAAAITRGAQSVAGIGTTIKHLAANNQETNRNYNNAHVSERALREIYLKGFEICVRESQPFAAMTSVNLINGIHTANDPDLLTSVLRDEWGFMGIVLTDWGTTGAPGQNKGQKYDCSSAVACIKAGNDVIMPGSQRDLDALVAARETGELTLQELQSCAANIVRLLLRAAGKTAYQDRLFE